MNRIAELRADWDKGMPITEIRKKYSTSYATIHATCGKRRKTVGRPRITDVLDDITKQEIIDRFNDGVSRKRLCKDYSISYPAMKSIV